MDGTSPLPANRADELTALREQVERLKETLEQSRTVGIATGLVMGRFHIGQQEAFERLKRHARCRQAKLITVATELLLAHESLDRLYEPLELDLGAAQPKSDCA